jgi:hypothetical protein
MANAARSCARVIACVLAGITAIALTPAPTATTSAPAVSPQAGGRGVGPAPVTVIEPPRPPAVGSGAISGVITDAGTGRPISGALVFLGGNLQDGPRPRQVTDEAGRFVFTDLPPADYGLSASHPDYLFASFNAAPGEAAARIVLTDAEWFADANIQLSRPASLSGTVLDERGEPVVGVPVRVLRAVDVAGATRWATGPAGETDDRGMYRVSDLRPGTYIVHVPSVQITLADGAVRPPSPPQRPLAMARTGGAGVVVGHFPTSGVPGRGYPMAYHPTARSASEAMPIHLEPGESRSALDVHLTLAPTVRVSGVLSGPPEAIASLPVWLVPAGDEPSGPGGEVAVTMSDPDGRFTLLNVPTGSYTLLASRSQSEFTVGVRGWERLMPERGSAFNISMSGGSVAGAPGVSYATRGRAGVAAFGRMPLLVDDRDVANVVVPLTSGVRVSGHFLWDGQSDRPDGLVIPMVGLEPADGDLSRGFPQSPSRRDDTGSPVPFTIDGVLPGRYLMGVTLVTRDFTLEAAEWRGRDLLSSPLEVSGDADITGVVVHLTSRPTRVSGTVLDASGTPAAWGAVIVFPASESAWETRGFRARRFRSVPIGGRGAYVITQLPPGEYLVTAIPASDRARWLEREFLSTAAATATRVRVESGAAIAVDVRMTGGRQ